MLVAVLAAVAGYGAAVGWRWPTMLAAVSALMVAAVLMTGSSLARAGLLAVAAAIVAEVSGWQAITPGTDLVELITDAGRHREQLLRELAVAALLIAACVLFAVAVLRHAAPGVASAAVAPLVVGGVLLGTRTWLAADAAYRTLITPPPDLGGESGAFLSVGVAVDHGPDFLSGLTMVAAVAGAVVLSYACTHLSRRAPA